MNFVTVISLICSPVIQIPDGLRQEQAFTLDFEACIGEVQPVEVDLAVEVVKSIG